MPAHPRRKIETRVGSYGSGDGSDRRRNKNDRDFSMAWSRGANDRQEETEAAAVSSSSSSSSSSLDEFDLLYGPEYRPTPLEDPRLKEWAIVDEIGEGRDEDGVDISRAINEVWCVCGVDVDTWILRILSFVNIFFFFPCSSR